LKELPVNLTKMYDGSVKHWKNYL